MKRMIVTSLCFIATLGAMEQLPGGISISRAQEKHIPAITALSNEVSNEFLRPLYATEYPGNPFAQNTELLDTFFDKFDIGFANHLKNAISNAENNNAHVLLALDNEDLDKILGICTFTKKEDSIYINSMFVSQYLRRKGIGKALLKAALSTYTDITFCQFKTFAFGNEQMHKPCEHYGFINKGITTLAMMPEGTPATHILYQLDIKK
jgi:predicted GNAT family acetyltransferase